MKTSDIGSSNVSDISSIARLKRAKTKSVRLKITFAEQQAALLKQDAVLEEQAVNKQTEIKAEIDQEAISAMQETKHRKAKTIHMKARFEQAAELKMNRRTFAGKLK